MRPVAYPPRGYGVASVAPAAFISEDKVEKLEGMQVSIDKGNYVALKLGSLPMFSMMPDEARVLASRLLLVADAAAAAAKLEDTN